MNFNLSPEKRVPKTIPFSILCQHRGSLPSNRPFSFLSRITSASLPILTLRANFDANETTSSHISKHFHNHSAPTECLSKSARLKQITSNSSTLPIRSSVNHTANNPISDTFDLSKFSQYRPQLSITPPPTVVPPFEHLSSFLPFGSAQSYAQTPFHQPTNPFISSVTQPGAPTFISPSLAAADISPMSQSVTTHTAHLLTHRTPLAPLLIPCPQASSSLPRASNSCASSSSCSPFQSTNPFLPLAPSTAPCSSPLRASPRAVAASNPLQPVHLQHRAPRAHNDSLSASTSASVSVSVEFGGATSAPEDADSESELDSQQSATGTGTELEELQELALCRAAQSTPRILYPLTRLHCILWSSYAMSYHFFC